MEEKENVKGEWRGKRDNLKEKGMKMKKRKNEGGKWKGIMKKEDGKGE